MDIKIVDDKGLEVKIESEPMESKQIEGSIFPELERKAIGSVLGLERDSELSYFGDKLNTLLEFAKSQTSNHSPENLKAIIRSLGNKIGSPPLGEKPINYVARYAYLLLEEIKLNQQKKQFNK